MPYTYPYLPLDNSAYLLRLLGGFWDSIYEGSALVQGTVFARGQLDAEAYLQFLDLIRATSHYDVPVYHQDHWYLLRFLETEVIQASIPKFLQETLHVFQPSQDLAYGLPYDQDGYFVPCPESLARTRLVMNRLTNPSLTLVEGVDFWRPAAGWLLFRDNPFASELTPLRDVYDETTGEITDREAGLWVFRGDFDFDTVYRQFGYALGLRLRSSEGYKALVSAVLAAFAEGATGQALHLAWTAITDIPLAREEAETVEFVQEDARSLVVVTDQHAYTFPLGSTPLVEAGDTVALGDPLVDTLQIYEFGNGEVDPELTGLAMGAGFLASGYLGPLRFENETVPWVVETVDGLTKMSFEIHGYPGDVAQFWDEVHARGVAQGQTLAHLLDPRTNKIGEPAASVLPATVNPLEFLCQNLLRYHVCVVRVKASRLGPGALGLAAADHLRRIIPAEKAMIVLVELSSADTIEMAGPGTTATPGYAENVTAFVCGSTAETLGPANLQERVRAYQIRGKCE